MEGLAILKNPGKMKKIPKREGGGFDH